LVLLDRSDLDQGRADAGSVLLLLLLRFAKLLDRDQILPDEQFTEAAGGHAFALTSEGGCVERPRRSAAVLRSKGPEKKVSRKRRGACQHDPRRLHVALDLRGQLRDRREAALGP